jgi:hypothetical protein
VAAITKARAHSVMLVNTRLTEVLCGTPRAHPATPVQNRLKGRQNATHVHRAVIRRSLAWISAMLARIALQARTEWTAPAIRPASAQSALRVSSKMTKVTTTQKSAKRALLANMDTLTLQWTAQSTANRAMKAHTSLMALRSHA